MTSDALIIVLLVLFVLLAVFSLRDIHILKEKNKELIQACQYWEALATLDPLTGAKSRLSLTDCLEHEIEMVKRSEDEQSSLVLYLDLDDFKLINDRHGHDVGDQVLQALVKSIKYVIRKSDDIYRLGGDEFIVFAKVDGKQGALQLMEKIKLALRLVSVEGEGHTISFTVSVGGTFIVRTEESATDLIRRADNALYISKREKGKGASYVFYQYGKEPIYLSP